MGALGDQKAEVEERAGDALAGAFGAVRDHFAARRVEFDAELLLGRGDPAYRVGVVPGPDADPGHMPEPGGRGPGHAQGVGDVLAVGPGLHEPGARHGRDAHRRPVPGDPGAVRGVAKDLVEPGPALPPADEQGVRGMGGDQGVGRLVDEGVGGGQGLGHLVAEPVRLGGRQHRDLVGPAEMGDLVGDGPPLRRGRSAPARGIQLPDQFVEFIALFAQIVDHGYDSGHVRPLGTGCGAQEHGSAPRNNQARLHDFLPGRILVPGAARPGAR
ncbi:hypothetical protein SBADM41S_01344 [Streptomyces badius]